MSSSKGIGPTSLVDVLSPSLKDDPTIQASAVAVDGALIPVVQAIPRMLMWARLWGDDTHLLPSLRRIVQFCGGLTPLSDAELELLAWQMHVDFWDPSWPREVRENLVKYSTRWHRLKGTPAGMKMAFSLFGMNIGIEEDGEGDYWATYQLGLPEIADLETVKLVCTIAYEMHPQRCELYRIYTDVWDVRPGTYDVGFYDDVAYDYYSGVEVPGLPGDGGLIVSFGRLNSAQTCPTLTVLLVGRMRTRGAFALIDDDMGYDVARYDDTFTIPNHGFIRSRLNSIVIGTPIYRRYGWTGLWDGRKWLDLESVGFEREPFTFARRSIAVSEGVYDDSVYDGLNSFYEQPVFTLVDNPPRYDDAAYDNHDPMRHTVRVDEVTVRALLTGALETILPADARAFAHVIRDGEHALEFPPFLPPAPAWNGKWDKRLWRAGGAYANLIHKETA